jgi:hypothetical protein
MGTSMCGHLIDAGHQTTIYSRTRMRAQQLLDKGAAWAETPVEVAARSEVIFTMVGYPADVREVVLGEQGVLAGAANGAVIVDMSTSEPTQRFSNTWGRWTRPCPAAMSAPAMRRSRSWSAVRRRRFSGSAPCSR